MTVPVASGAAGFLARYEGLKDHLPGARRPWLNALRREAADHFAARGLPTRRVEAWKYTDLSPVAQASFSEPLTSVDGDLDLPAALTPARVVFVDGRLRADLSTLANLPFSVRSLALHLGDVETRLGALAKPASESFAALNTMLFEDGLLLTVPAGIDGGVLEVLSIAAPSERPFAFHPRHLIRLEQDAKLVIVERSLAIGDARYLHNPVFEIEVAAGASLTHGRMQQEAPLAFHLSTIYATVAAGGTYDNFTVAAGARLARNEIHAALTGPKATCHMNGAQLVGDGQVADTTTALDHAAPDCASRQTYKTVLTGRSRGVFQGKILVRRPAQKTDGYQMNQALLLSDDAEMDSKPQLEIYADDVKCSHGATVGALDPDQLFYLRARGIPQAEARAMLVEAFLHEAVETVSDETLRTALMHTVDGWWRAREAHSA